MRRSVVARLLCVAVLLGATSGPSFAQAGRGVVRAHEGDLPPVRVTLPLVTGWRFVQDDTLAEDAALEATGAGWQAVSLPHTWNAHDAATTAATVPYKRGRGWYRLEFAHPARGARHWLQFDGASIVADVWLNGQKLGQHKGAFTAFRFDLTEALRPGVNVLLVRTDNAAPAADGDVTAIAPLGGDFNMAGGLYRRVSLVSTLDDVHVALDDLGGPGVYARTMSMAGGGATVAVRVKVSNDAARRAAPVVIARLIDAAGTPAGEARQTVRVAAGGRAETVLEIRVAAAHPWQGLAAPYLYRLVVDLRDAGGRVRDRVVQGFGIRQMTFDPDEGFSLNGRRMPLHGVAMHQDYVEKAWALSERDTDESLALIKEIGANTVRLAHYPHGEYTLRQADEIGVVTWAEVPFVNGTRVACSGEQPTSEFTANLEQQLRELIRQQYNHASIGMWSIGNETTMFQALECGRTGARGIDNVTPVLRRLQEVAKAEDPGRVTTLADLNEGMRMFGGYIPVGGISDVWALNRYYLWYYGTSADEFARNLDELHAKYPRQPIGVSEYGAGAALGDHTDNPLGGPVSSFNMGLPRVYQPEEYANWVHEQNYAVMTARKYVWGTYVWNMFDFGSGIRNEGDLRGVNTKGLVTFDRKTRKDAFFFYKANWSAQPVTYITARRHATRAYAVTDVKVYSNAESVQLLVDGVEAGTLTAAQCPRKACTFKNVALAPGRNVVVARGKHGTTVLSDEVTWTVAAGRGINIAAGQLETGLRGANGTLYGSDNFFEGGTGGALAPTSLTGPRDGTPVSGVTDKRDAELYAAFRSGRFRYDIPLANGEYTVTLGFLEPAKSTAVGGRVFDVEANGVKVIAAFDVLRAAEGYRKVITKSFPVSVANGRLDLRFLPSAGEAVVSNISVAVR